MRSERLDPDGRVIVEETTVVGDKELRDAYERGRKDEAGRHKRNWLTTILTWLLALVGVVVLALAALNGSFQRGGAVIDQQLSIAADQAEPAIREAASDAGEAIQDVQLPAVPTNDPEIPVTDPNDPSVVQAPAGSEVTTTTTTTEAR
jgi:hypothetical protein